MPSDKIPVELCSYDESFTYENNYKTDSVSSRASSPKSCTTDWTSPSEASESPEGSVISDLEVEADRIANDLDNMKITEIQAEEMMKEGADMRHVLQAAYRLKPKNTKKFKKGTKINGRALMKLLNFESYNEKAEELDQKQRMARAWAQYEQSLNKNSKGCRPPPGFEKLDDIIARKINNSESDKPACLVAYANGTNTLNLSSEPMAVHDITVSCVVDTCHVFLQQMNNPTFVGLENLESELFSTYSMEKSKPLLRPIAHGSVLAVFSDNKWYRCQVVDYNPVADTCNIKFVDHGGYTTVPAKDLRQLKSDFLRLPFQAIEVYLAHVDPAKKEMQKDIASEILFHANISVQLLGMADDGIPMIQAYYYDGDYINIFTQEIVDACMVTIETVNKVNARSIEENTETEYVKEETEDRTHIEKEIKDEEPISPNTTIEQQPQYYYPADVYCQQSGAYYQTQPDNCHPMVQQPTIAYTYLDANGMQQVYYVAGPFVYPVNMATPASPQESLNNPPSSGSEISFGSFDTDEVESLSSKSSQEVNTSSTSSESEEVTLDSKPYEEWTQEDYARYYGDV